jgi:LemA protein
MAVPLRKILRVFYPDRLLDGRSRQVGGQSGSSNIKRIVLLVLLVLITTKAILLLFYYNTFLSLQYDVEESTAQIDTQLQRRKNIILNLSLMVRDYATHEKEIFKHTTETRKQMLNPVSGASLKMAASPQGSGSPASQAPAGQDASRSMLQITAADLAGKISKQDVTAFDLESLLSKVFAVAERYPDLRLSENFQNFMDALVEAESKIAEQRMIYNQRANDMSTALGKFPGLIFAKIYGFEAPPFFESEPEARIPPDLE